MREKTIIFSVFILILAFAGFIFISGERVINEESSAGFSTFYFTSNNHSAENFQGFAGLLEISINNHELSDVDYELAYIINGVQLEKFHLTLAGGESKKIAAPGKLIDYLSSQTEGNYLVKIGISWNSSSEYLTRNINTFNASTK